MRSTELQNRLDVHNNMRRVGAPCKDAVLSLRPLQAHTLTGNNQMLMYRDGLFMSKAVTDGFQEGERHISTWGLLNSNLV